MAESTVLGMDIIPFHDVAHIFPMMAAEEFAELVDDIRDHGLHEPIWLHEDQIIDGRNRYNACMEAGIEPEYRVWNGQGSLIQFVVSLNLKRRHLTSSQRAMIALDILPRLEAEARERQGIRTDLLNFPELIPESSHTEHRESREVAAEMTNTNPRYVSDAKRIIQEDTTLADRVRAGELSIPAAKSQLSSMQKAVHDSQDTDKNSVANNESPQILPQGCIHHEQEMIGYEQINAYLYADGTLHTTFTNTIVGRSVNATYQPPGTWEHTPKDGLLLSYRSEEDKAQIIALQEQDRAHWERVAADEAIEDVGAMDNKDEDEELLSLLPFLSRFITTFIQHVHDLRQARQQLRVISSKGRLS